MPRFLVTALFLLALPVGGAAAEKSRVVESPASSSARPATTTEVAKLNELLHKTADDYRRWAYTETRVMRDDKGRTKSETVLRHDPSKPYAEQWTPLKIGGKDPTERERAQYRRRGEKSAPSEKPASLSNSSNQRNQRSLGELIDVNRSSIASETATHLVFEVPLIKVGNERFPPEKFLVHARIRKLEPALENISVRLRESFRSKLVVKVKSGEGSLDFAVVNPKYPPVLVAVEGDAVASILFVSVGGSMDLKRTDLKHVKPFDEQFDVQIGTLKAIDF